MMKEWERGEREMTEESNAQIPKGKEAKEMGRGSKQEKKRGMLK